MFNGAQNVVIQGGVFAANVEGSINASQGPNLVDRLLDRVALNAILNAGGRADDVGCYPGTRNIVIGKVEKWMDGQSEPDHRMLWLSGPAGAGKSSIMQTVAERCKERGTHAANFFFFRGDPTRNNSQPLVATLVYQLLECYPALHEHLKDRLSAKPLTYKASTAEQFIEFVSSPFKIIQDSLSIHQPIILIVDGLDECDDKREQERILGALHALVEKDHSPFRVLVASRAEHHLKMSFNNIGTSAGSIFLDGNYGPEDDIRRFVIAKFDEIKRLHPLSPPSSEDWPTNADIDAIVVKSSGQFIYAATVMRFIRHSSKSPVLSLRTIHGIGPTAGDNPLAHINAVYSYILSMASDIQTVKLILCMHIIVGQSRAFRTPANLQYLLQLVGYDAIETRSFFADLVSIIQVTTDPTIDLVFYHASLADYLQNKSQSGIYHVNVGELAAELICLKKCSDHRSLMHAIFVLGHVEDASTELSDSFLKASSRRFKSRSQKQLVPWEYLVRIIEKLYFDRDRPSFILLLQSWLCFAYIHNINPDVGINLQSASAYRYYKWYRTIERVKFVLRLSK